jgi:hypothetical protein
MGTVEPPVSHICQIAVCKNRTKRSSRRNAPLSATSAK